MTGKRYIRSLSNAELAARWDKEPWFYEAANARLAFVWPVSPAVVFAPRPEMIPAPDPTPWGCPRGNGEFDDRAHCDHCYYSPRPWSTLYALGVRRDLSRDANPILSLFREGRIPSPIPADLGEISLLTHYLEWVRWDMAYDEQARADAKRVLSRLQRLAKAVEQ